MLKRALIGLVALNGGLLFWAVYQHQAATSTTEPQRMQQQVAPDRLQVQNLLKSQATAPAPVVNTGATSAINRPASSANGTLLTPAPAVAADEPPAPVTSSVSGGEALAPVLQPNRIPTPPPVLSPAPASVVTRCWQLPGLTPGQMQSLEAKLNNQLPQLANLWGKDTAVKPARWIVYTGKLTGEAEVQKRRTALKAMGVEFRGLNNQSLEPGLALGTYSTKEAAQQALTDVTRKGVKGARVEVERPEQTSYTLMLPRLTDTDKRAFDAVVPASAGRPLSPC